MSALLSNKYLVKGGIIEIQFETVTNNERIFAVSCGRGRDIGIMFRFVVGNLMMNYLPLNSLNIVAR